MRRRRAKSLPVVRRLSLSMAMVAWSVAPACAGDGGSIDGTGKLILRGLGYLAAGDGGGAIDGAGKLILRGLGLIGKALGLG
jgi:hypothetical protein